MYLYEPGSWWRSTIGHGFPCDSSGLHCRAVQADMPQQVNVERWEGPIARTANLHIVGMEIEAAHLSFPAAKGCVVPTMTLCLPSPPTLKRIGQMR